MKTTELGAQTTELGAQTTELGAHTTELGAPEPHNAIISGVFRRENHL